MDNLIISTIIIIILGLCIGYIVNAKKKGVKCIGCPSSGKCSSNCGSCTSDCVENKDIISPKVKYDEIIDFKVHNNS